MSLLELTVKSRARPPLEDTLQKPMQEPPTCFLELLVLRDLISDRDYPVDLKWLKAMNRDGRIKYGFFDVEQDCDYEESDDDDESTSEEGESDGEELSEIDKDEIDELSR